jgi:PhnB protein
MAAVDPIPKGYHALTPYLRVRGAAAAIDFYNKAFGATELLRLTTPDGTGIMHAEVMIGDSHLMLGEEAPQMGLMSPLAHNGVGSGVHLYVKDVDAVFARAVELGAKPAMPPQDMFWGDRYGKLTDPFGHEWSIATHVEDVSDEETRRRADKLFGG